MVFDPKSVTFLMGPTASGKTALAAELVRHYPFEIISVDSAMIYRGLDIGSAKPTPQELKLVPHRLINITDPSERYSVAAFCQAAKREIQAIFNDNKWPLLVGGTMLYFKALRDGLSALPGRDPVIREQILKEAKQIGWPALHDKLARLDSQAAKKIQPNDQQRIQRALEVIMLTGKPMSVLQQQQDGELPLACNINACAIAPNDRALLHQRIEKRFDLMLEKGFIEEVRLLKAQRGLDLSLPAIRSVGYRQVWQMLEGELTEKAMHEKALTATRRLAKRQLTWLRAWPKLKWFDSEAGDLLGQVVNWLEIEQ